MLVMSGMEMVRKLRKMISLWGLQVRILIILLCLDAAWVDVLLGSNHAWAFVGNALLPDQEEYLEAGAERPDETGTRGRCSQSRTNGRKLIR